jgi:hypothetical protein
VLSLLLSKPKVFQKINTIYKTIRDLGLIFSTRAQGFKCLQFETLEAPLGVTASYCLVMLIK